LILRMPDKFELSELLPGSMETLPVLP
jgi:hypothetical protein